MRRQPHRKWCPTLAAAWPGADHALRNGEVDRHRSHVGRQRPSAASGLAASGPTAWGLTTLRLMTWGLTTLTALGLTVASERKARLWCRSRCRFVRRSSGIALHGV